MSANEKDKSIMTPLSRRNLLGIGSALGGAALARMTAHAQTQTNTRGAESAAEIQSIPAEKTEIIAGS